MKTIFCLAYLSLIITTVNAQFTTIPESDYKFTKKEKKHTSSKKSLITKRIVPMALITSGILLSTSNFEKSLQKDVRSAVGDDFISTIDDYTRYAPVIQMYAADILGAKSKNHWFDQTRNLMISTLISNGASTILKKEVYKVRPGGLAPGSNHANSFPSGHTTSLRMMNNAHFISDVLVGAGIGIMVTKLVYHFDYLIAWNPFKKMDGIVMGPQFDQNGIGFNFTKVF